MKTVPLYGKKAAGRVALVDDADYELVMQYRWNVREYVRPNGSIVGPYAFTGSKKNGRVVIVRLHRLLMPGAGQVDHEDGDGLNNQRSNLRPATDVQNHANQRKNSTWRGRPTSSRFKGVYWSKARCKWVAQIQAGRGRRCHLGSFAEEADAARAYDAAAREVFGEYARVNFP